MCIHMHMHVYKDTHPPVQGCSTPIYSSMHCMCIAMISHQQQLQQMLQQYLLLLAIVALLASVGSVRTHMHKHVHKGMHTLYTGVQYSMYSSMHCMYTTAYTSPQHYRVLCYGYNSSGYCC